MDFCLQEVSREPQSSTPGLCAQQSEVEGTAVLEQSQADQHYPQETGREDSPKAPESKSYEA